ncbi:uncharacterized protein EDB93DRAFT_1108753 [Suillus bovinus]|uniref:uncharacterized protein n=1 Tax=Suillus bovinus TaxID=48563 RepID=UPI001B862E85|nr:uncharacterized protein EDB93DRAFT_1108753 [Suillus bovinus]KAG2129225.1 hypothetical protein EDB93DRAFT_1108753 [Suillus bovinus]
MAPDFEAEEYALAHAQLMNETTDEQQTAEILANLWEIQNNADKRQWEVRIQEEAQAAEEEQRQTAEAEAQKQQALLAEKEAAISEEQKKNKSKYAPIRNIDVPSNPIILPCQYAI